MFVREISNRKTIYLSFALSLSLKNISTNELSTKPFFSNRSKKVKDREKRRENLISLYIFNSFVRSFESSFALMKQKIVYIYTERE